MKKKYVLFPKRFLIDIQTLLISSTKLVKYFSPTFIQKNYLVRENKGMGIGMSVALKPMRLSPPKLFILFN